MQTKDLKIHLMTTMTKKRTQNKENYYYVFWVVAMIAFIVPQVYTAIAYHKLADILTDAIEVKVVEE